MGVVPTFNFFEVATWHACVTGIVEGYDYVDPYSDYTASELLALGMPSYIISFTLAQSARMGKPGCMDCMREAARVVDPSIADNASADQCEMALTLAYQAEATERVLAGEDRDAMHADITDKQARILVESFSVPKEIVTD